MSHILAGSGLIFRAQQEICDVHCFDPLIIFVYLFADIYGCLYIAKVYGYNRNTFFKSKVLRFISAKLFQQDNFDGLHH